MDGFGALWALAMQEDAAAGGLDRLAGGLDWAGAPIAALAASPLVRRKIPQIHPAVAAQLHPALRNPAVLAQLAPQGYGMPQFRGPIGEMPAISHTGITPMAESIAEVAKRAASVTDFTFVVTSNVIPAGASGTAFGIAPVALKPSLVTVPDPTQQAAFSVTDIKIGRVTFSVGGGTGTGQGIPCTMYTPLTTAGGQRVDWDPLDPGQTLAISVTNTSAAPAAITFVVGCLLVRVQDVARGLMGRMG